ncbi:MAG: IPExxxVDY family protein [Bacteroidales bacterium]|nr:IPExxxVDY family protein [Bacteroidales bacterium]
MKKIQKITRVQLNIDHDEDTTLLGLVCAEPDYKLSLLINNKLSISLKSVAPLKPGEDDGTQLTFSRFSFSKKVHEISYNLISNRCGKIFLINKLKNVDYIFSVYDPGKILDSELLTSQMREIETVNAVFYIDLLTFKDKNLHYFTH